MPANIEVKFENTKPKPIIKPTEMPSCVPFVGKSKEDGSHEVMLRTGSDAFVFFGSDNHCTFSREDDANWVDEHYEVVYGVEAEVVLKVS